MAAKYANSFFKTLSLPFSTRPIVYGRVFGITMSHKIVSTYQYVDNLAFFTLASDFPVFSFHYVMIHISNCLYRQSYFLLH